MSIGDSITQPIPAVSTAGTTYATQLVAFLQEAKARLEAKVALTSLLAGLFDLTNNPIANAKYVGLYEQASTPTTPVGSLQRYGGELYYVSPSGAVRVTNGGFLDIAATGGITGNYAAPAEFRYDLPSLEYYAYSNQTAAPKQWARVGAQGFDLYGTLTGTTRVRIAWAGGANPSFTWTLPATLPASTQILQVDSTGQLIPSNTVVNDTTMAANKHVIVSGTGRYKHGTFKRAQQVVSDYATAGAVSTGVGATSGQRSMAIASASTTFYFRLDPLDAGKRITSITLDAPNYESGTAAISYDLVRLTASLADFQSLLSAPVSSAAANPGTVTLTPNGGSWTVVGNESLWIKVVVPAATSVSFITVAQNYDHP